ncbi:exo-alpha-sialidase [Paenibacillus sp. OV219]|uniref:sialidase family protein n=1 Tax=Paenibacillus sp. OV219 TaxID=1884377 RepID=UPI0008BB4C6B|nr:sialidase family protein [Paenibacillus sp. OV219]SEO73268.1 Predicted neuraminidase (sialidase) [Paenibacillus sp. OV219]
MANETQVIANKQYIFEEGQPFRSSHASTVAVLPGGDVVAAWFAGKHEKSSDVAIWMSRRVEGVWSAPYKAMDEEGIAHWNPVLYAQGHSLMLFYKVGHEITDWYTYVSCSEDGGISWEKPHELVPGDVGGRGPVRNKPIALLDGTLLAPASVERLDPAVEGKQIWEAFVDISRDNGQTWTKSELVPMDLASYVGADHWFAKGLIQPTLWSSGGEHVHMLLRSTEGWIFRSDSVDNGRTWCLAYKTSLPNNNSGIDVTLMDNGKLALVLNPVAGYATDSPRTPLVVRFSGDNGMTWEDEFILEQEPGEYSYPAIVSKGNELYITYTWNRDRIAFWTLAVD